MDDSKTVLVLLFIFLLVGAGFFGYYQIHSERKVQHHSEIKNGDPCEKSTSTGTIV